MKVKCISQCQTDRKVLYEVGKIYEVTEELYKTNKDRFEEVKKVKEDGKI